MKQFITTNLFRLVIATAILMFAIAFFVFALQNNTANAGTPVTKKLEQVNRWIVANEKGIFEVIREAGQYPEYRCYKIF